MIHQSLPPEMFFCFFFLVCFIILFFVFCFYVFMVFLFCLFILTLSCRYPHQKALRGSASLLYAVGVSIWVNPLAKALPYVEMAFELNGQVS